MQTNDKKAIIEAPKLYCPYCKLELNGNGHKSENMAWALFECEYRPLSDEKQPIPELIMQKKRIERLRNRKREIDLALNSANARISELETINCGE